MGHLYAGCIVETDSFVMFRPLDCELGMNQKLKTEINTFLHERGADLVGMASPEIWDRENMVHHNYRPRSIWPQTTSIIVIGIEMPLPVVETTPSVQHRDLYNNCNRTLDGVAFELSRWLNRRGYASINLSRDGYATINVLLNTPEAAFSHTFAAYYAGLGHIGINNTILTRQFGPRVRFTSVFTEAAVPPDSIMDTICIRCGACAELCPVNALTISRSDLRGKNVIVADYDRHACALWAKTLTGRGCYPCGICIKVCPVGEDRTLYKRHKALGHYRKELTAPVLDAPDPLHRSWNHIRRFGSRLFDDDVRPQDTLQDIFQKIKREMMESNK
jgi:epoxyqueuosine reductase